MVTKIDTQILTEWAELKAQLSELKEREMILRRSIVNQLFPVYEEGTNKLELDDCEVVFKATMNRKLIVPNETVEQLVQSGELPAELFKVKYELQKSVYNKLTDEQINIVEGIIETKDNAPVLEIKYEK